MKRWKILCWMIALCDPTCLAGELDGSRIPAGTQWIAHIDLEAFKSSQLLRLALESEAGHPLPHPLDFSIPLKSENFDFSVNWDALTEVYEQFGVNPLEDLLSVTVFSAGPTPERAVVLALTTDKLDQAIDKARKFVRSESFEADGQALQRWFEEDSDKPYQFSCIERRGERRIVTAAFHLEDLLAALKVRDGDASSLKDSEAAFIPRTTSAGCFFFAAANDGALAGLDRSQRSQVARMAKSLQFEAGEHDGKTYLKLAATAASDAEARKVMQILQGASALLSLVAQSNDDRELDQFQRLVQSLDFHCEGSRFEVRFERESKDLVELIHGRATAAAEAGKTPKKYY